MLDYSKYYQTEKKRKTSKFIMVFMMVFMLCKFCIYNHTVNSKFLIFEPLYFDINIILKTFSFLDEYTRKCDCKQ